MNRHHRILALLTLLASGALCACSASVNAPIVLDDGEQRAGNLSSVNGPIDVGRNCKVEGSVRSVNGGVEVGAGSQVGGLGTVNGGIGTDRDVTVERDVESVNGPVDLGPGTRVGGEVKTVNGPIDLAGTVVDGDVRTVNGGIRLAERSVVKGDVRIEGKRRGFGDDGPLYVELDGESVIEGGVIVEDERIEVRVVLRGGSKVLGAVEGAELIDEAPAD